jgi:hypothetical protein
VAAAEAIGAEAVGVERFAEYFKMAQEAVPRLARLHVSQPGIGVRPAGVAPVPLFD